MNRITYEICHNEKGQWWWRQLYNSNCKIACSSQIYSPNNVKNSRQGAIRGAVGHHKAMYYWKNWTNKQAKQDMLFRGILKIFDEVRAAEGETK